MAEEGTLLEIELPELWQSAISVIATDSPQHRAFLKLSNLALAQVVAQRFHHQANPVE